MYVIEIRGGDVEVVTDLERRQERRHRHCLGARGAVRIGPGEADEMQVALLQTLFDLLRLPFLVVAVEAVLVDEGHESPVRWAFIVGEAVTFNQLNYRPNS